MKRLIYFLFVFFVTIMAGCSKMVKTGEVSNLEATTADIAVYIKSEIGRGYVSFNQYNVLLGESEEELVHQSKALKEEFKSLKKQYGKDYFDDCHEQYRFDPNITIDRLNPATKYYYRAWAVKNRKLYFGDIKTFETPDLPPISGTHEGHDYVDLGLPSGLKWATCNIGASSPEEYGNFFAWAEVRPKQEYTWKTYRHAVYSRYYGGHYAVTKYKATEALSGSSSTKQLHKGDDAAHVNWGGNWRMPTIEDYWELQKICDFEWTTLSGVKGLKIIGPNEYSIFLPAAGFMNDPTNYSVPDEIYVHKGRSVLYWLSTYDADVLPSSSKIANCINRDGNWASVDEPVRGAKYRCNGLPIRPVCP